MGQWVVQQYEVENRDNTHVHNLTQADVAGDVWPIRALSLSCITASFSVNALFTLISVSILSAFKSILLIVRTPSQLSQLISDRIDDSFYCAN